MTTQNNEAMPSRRAGESCADFFARIDLLWEAHCNRCDACNYDRDDCPACNADGEHAREAHACNCTGIEPPGYGVQLQRLRDAARRDWARETRGE